MAVNQKLLQQMLQQNADLGTIEGANVGVGAKADMANAVQTGGSTQTYSVPSLAGAEAEAQLAGARNTRQSYAQRAMGMGDKTMYGKGYTTLQDINKPEQMLGEQKVKSGEQANAIVDDIFQTFNYDPEKFKVETLTTGTGGTTVTIKEREIDTGKLKVPRIQARNDLFNAEFKIGNTYDAWLNMLDYTQRKHGLDPGVFAGTWNSVAGPAKANPYYEGFKGGLVEYGAAIGRIAMPGTRASRIIDLFKKGAPTQFSSIASGTINAAISFKNAIATDLASAKSSEGKGWKEYEGLIKKHGGTERSYLEWAEQTFKDAMGVRVIQKNPDLMPIDQEIELFGGILGQDSETGDYFVLDPETNQPIRKITENLGAIRGE